jgi:hypothetical protein
VPWSQALRHMCEVALIGCVWEDEGRKQLLGPYVGLDCKIAGSSLLCTGRHMKF